VDPITANIRIVRAWYKTASNRFPCIDRVFPNMVDALIFSETHECYSVEIYDIDNNLLYSKIN